MGNFETTGRSRAGWLLGPVLGICATLTLAQTDWEEAREIERAAFYEDLEVVDNALKTNPTGALRQSLESCLNQRRHATVLMDIGMIERARRSLQYCFDSLDLARNTVEKVTGPTEEELQARAAREYEEAMGLTPDVDNGRAIYAECAACHKPEGWGLLTGIVPQIAGQHRNVVISQLADYRAGARDSVLMVPYATAETIGGAQAIADVAEYISTLEISVQNGKGDGADLAQGEELYRNHCAVCHGASGEGSNERAVPRLQAQHYKYLVRQFEWIRDGKRRNVGDKMKFVEGFSDEEMAAVLDYASRLMPQEEFRAPPGWKNPDFVERITQ
jgi:cytochrome c553